MPHGRLSSRDALIRAALTVFGQRGREGASTRDIAAAAGMPMSQITYHFGGKDGLYLACAQEIALVMARLMGTAVAEIDARFDRASDAATACELLGDLIGRLAQAMLGDDVSVFVAFMLREQTEPSEAFAVIYSGIMGEVLARITRLVATVAGPSCPTERAQIVAITMMGQILVFRAARATVLRLTGWSAIAADQVEAIRAQIVSNVCVICAQVAKTAATAATGEKP